MPGINPFPERLPDDKAKAIAERRTAALKEQAGMFAEYVEPVTSEMVQAGTKAHHDKFQRTMEEQQERGDRCRRIVATLITPELLAVLDKRRAVLPGGSEYHADFWTRTLQQLTEEPFPLPDR